MSGRHQPDGLPCTLFLKAEPRTDAVMWSWCGQIRCHISDMQRYLIAPLKNIVANTKARFLSSSKQAPSPAVASPSVKTPTLHCACGEL